MKGYVYVLSNPAMPGVLKIGWSVSGAWERAKQLFASSTGVPAQFVVEMEVRVDDPERIEKLAHWALEHRRISSSREFFRCAVHEAIEAVLQPVLRSNGLEILPTEARMSEAIDAFDSRANNEAGA